MSPLHDKVQEKAGYRRTKAKNCQRSFFRFLLLEVVEAETICVEAEAVDEIAASTSLVFITYLTKQLSKLLAYLHQIYTISRDTKVLVLIIKFMY